MWLQGAYSVFLRTLLLHIWHTVYFKCTGLPTPPHCPSTWFFKVSLITVSFLCRRFQDVCGFFSFNPWFSELNDVCRHGFSLVYLLYSILTFLNSYAFISLVTFWKLWCYAFFLPQSLAPLKIPVACIVDLLELFHGLTGAHSQCKAVKGETGHSWKLASQFASKFWPSLTVCLPLFTILSHQACVCVCVLIWSY